ncbi:MAG: hypothetical protein AB7I01_06540 [Gammaproteobacteria bacterium]
MLLGLAGNDVLRLVGAGQLLDCAHLPRGTVRGIETLDLAGSGDNTVALTLADLIDLDAGATLRVDGGAGDAVLITDSGWSVSPGGPVNIASEVYQPYIQAGATLLIDTDVAVRLA